MWADLQPLDFAVAATAGAVFFWAHQPRNRAVFARIKEGPMADMNTEQQKRFHVQVLTARGKVVSVTASDVSWSIDNPALGQFQSPEPDGACVFVAQAAGIANVSCSVKGFNPSVSLEIEDAPAASAAISSDPPEVQP